MTCLQMTDRDIAAQGVLDGLKRCAVGLQLADQRARGHVHGGSGPGQVRAVPTCLAQIVAHAQGLGVLMGTCENPVARSIFQETVQFTRASDLNRPQRRHRKGNSSCRLAKPNRRAKDHRIVFFEHGPLKGKTDPFDRHFMSRKP